MGLSFVIRSLGLFIILGRRIWGADGEDSFLASLSLKDYHTLRMLRLTMKVFFILGLARISGGY